MRIEYSQVAANLALLATSSLALSRNLEQNLRGRLTSPSFAAIPLLLYNHAKPLRSVRLFAS